MRGFTLVEMAVVLVLFGIVASMGLKMVNATLDNSAYSDTKAKQERIKTALISYLRTNGRLPCPDMTTDQTNASYGLQDRSGSVDSACTAIAGVFPWRDLQLSRSDVTDGWGNFFTYHVANSVRPDLINWTSRTVGTPFDINQLSISPAITVFTINERNGGTSSTIATNAVVVIISHGKNGLGARTVKGTTNTAPAAGTDEAVNATVNSATFYRSPYNEDTGVTGGTYDDIVTYLTPQDLLQPFVNEGALKACNAYCQVLLATFTCSSGSPRCTDGETRYCNVSGPACSSGGLPYCTTGATPQCPSASLAGCSATGIPIGNSNITCP